MTKIEPHGTRYEAMQSNLWRLGFKGGEHQE